MNPPTPLLRVHRLALLLAACKSATLSKPIAEGEDSQ
jgi:hypothetical protein